MENFAFSGFLRDPANLAFFRFSLIYGVHGDPDEDG